MEQTWLFAGIYFSLFLSLAVMAVCFVHVSLGLRGRRIAARLEQARAARKAAEQQIDIGARYWRGKGW